MFLALWLAQSEGEPLSIESNIFFSPLPSLEASK